MSISELGCQDNDIHLTSCIRRRLFCSSRAEVLTGNVLSMSMSCKLNNDQSSARPTSISVRAMQIDNSLLMKQWDTFISACPVVASIDESPLRILKAILVSFPHSDVITFANILLPYNNSYYCHSTAFLCRFLCQTTAVLSQFSAFIFRLIYLEANYIWYLLQFLCKREGALT